MMRRVWSGGNIDSFVTVKIWQRSFDQVITKDDDHA